MNPRPHLDPVDLIAIERAARRMQAQALANGLRVAYQWLRARLTGAAAGAAPANPARTA